MATYRVELTQAYKGVPSHETARMVDAESAEAAIPEYARNWKQEYRGTALWLYASDHSDRYEHCVFIERVA